MIFFRNFEFSVEKSCPNERSFALSSFHESFRIILLFTVFRSKYSEMDWVVKRSSVRGSDSGFEQSDNGGPQEESVVRLRGLPFDSTKMDIVKFFDGTSNFMGFQN